MPHISNCGWGGESAGGADGSVQGSIVSMTVVAEHPVSIVVAESRTVRLIWTRASGRRSSTRCYGINNLFA